MLLLLLLLLLLDGLNSVSPTSLLLIRSFFQTKSISVPSLLISHIDGLHVQNILESSCFSCCV